jgi:pimeloyl-ACP methyl ester carboxylesterase
MRLIEGLRAHAREIGRAVGDGFTDSGQAALYLRQLLRGNRAPPAIARSRVTDKPTETSAPGRPASTTAVLPLPPVLLIHGYLATRGSIHLLEQRLTERGHVVIAYRLGPIHLGDIRESAGYIARKIESMATQTGVDKVDVVAHSMGGLVALDYLKRLGGGKRIRRLVLLGTPIHGTWSAALGLLTTPLGRAGLQLLPGSTFLRELGEMPMPTGPEVFAVAAERDWLAPPHTTTLPGARHLTVPTGHSGLLVDEGVANTVSDILVASTPASAPR